MAAAAITPTLVMKKSEQMTATYGTPVRISTYFVKITKVTQADWVVAATYTPGTFLGWWGYTIDSSGNGAAETATYAATGTTIVFGSANVGTGYGWVNVQEV